MTREMNDSAQTRNRTYPVCNDDPPGVDPESLPSVLTVKETALMLRVRRKTVYEMIKNNELPGVIRKKKPIRILKNPVLEYTQGNSRVSRS